MVDDGDNGAPPARPPPARYVVSLRPTGLGDRLACLAAAWVFARGTGRTLVADWRRSSYAADRARNLFPLCFDAPDRLAGVPFVGDDRVARLHFPRPRHPSRWDDDDALAHPLGRPAADLYADRDRAVELIRSGMDVAAPTVIFDACINDGLVSLADARAFFDALRPAPRIARSRDTFAAGLSNTGLSNTGRPLIGLHARHGNGGEVGLHTPFWTDPADALERCRRAVAEARRRLGRPATVLLCTDSHEFAGEAMGAIPGIVTRPKGYRAPGEGELHGWNGAHRTLHDALVEMHLLAGCDALIRYPPGSFFSLPAAVAIGGPGTPAGTVHDLQRPWAADDPLSPAIIIRSRMEADRSAAPQPSSSR